MISLKITKKYKLVFLDKLLTVLGVGALFSAKCSDIGFFLPCLGGFIFVGFLYHLVDADVF